jgi:hypothetical protein
MLVKNEDHIIILCIQQKISSELCCSQNLVKGSVRIVFGLS